MKITDIAQVGKQTDDDDRLVFVDSWIPSLQADEAANDNDKEITVTAGYYWHILWVWVEYTSDANAGDRQLVLEIQDDSDDVVYQMRVGIVQAASLTRYYAFGPSHADLEGFRDTDYLMTPIPPTLILPPGYDVRIYDNNGVSAADDMVIQLMVAQRET